MNLPTIIETKRDGGSHDSATIRELVNRFTSGEVPDYQMAAWLMAVFFRGLSPAETEDLTLAMRDSGRVLAWPEDPRPVVDKHSTGGVGDKVSLVLAPLLAALGFRVPMISGRGLGITGGTLDKLEAIPGFNTRLEPDQIVSQVQDIGLAIVGQTGQMVPADRRIYALRDVTATVASIPLITASILSKKLAEGLAALMMDVKFGAAAFMKTREEAAKLAASIIDLAERCGLPTTAILTTMDAPLGMAAGNWLEVKEAVRCLDCYGPEDLQSIAVECAAQLLVQTGKARSLPAARQKTLESLVSGEPRRRFDRMVAAQGGDLKEFKLRLSRETLAPVLMDVTTRDEGFITGTDARVIGEVVRDLGGGRTQQESAIDPAVGVDEIAKPGEPFGVGSVLARVHAHDEASAREAVERLRTAFDFQRDPFDPPPLIIGL
ncbi:MAG: thymidine phosphorylase [Verrucomicrobiae bacterium]|nr:thymidine phosphorylase [Verrucomicrobiae bacterium]